MMPLPRYAMLIRIIHVTPSAMAETFSDEIVTPLKVACRQRHRRFAPPKATRKTRICLVF